MDTEDDIEKGPWRQQRRQRVRPDLSYRQVLQTAPPPVPWNQRVSRLSIQNHNFDAPQRTQVKHQPWVRMAPEVHQSTGWYCSDCGLHHRNVSLMQCRRCGYERPVTSHIKKKAKKTSLADKNEAPPLATQLQPLKLPNQLSKFAASFTDRYKTPEPEDEDSDAISAMETEADPQKPPAKDIPSRDAIAKARAILALKEAGCDDLAQQLQQSMEQQSKAAEEAKPAAKTVSVAYQQAVRHREKAAKRVAAADSKLEDLNRQREAAERDLELARADLQRADHLLEETHRALTPASLAKPAEVPTPTAVAVDLERIQEPDLEELERKYVILQDEISKSGGTPPTRTQYLWQEMLTALRSGAAASAGPSQGSAVAAAAPAAARAEGPERPKDDKDRARSRSRGREQGV